MICHRCATFRCRLTTDSILSHWNISPTDINKVTSLQALLRKAFSSPGVLVLGDFGFSAPPTFALKMAPYRSRWVSRVGTRNVGFAVEIEKCQFFHEKILIFGANPYMPHYNFVCCLIGIHKCTIYCSQNHLLFLAIPIITMQVSFRFGLDTWNTSLVSDK